MITGFEDPGGRPVLHVYPDPATGGKPWTYCDGETLHPRFGHTYSVTECDAETAAAIKSTDAAILACLGGTPPDNARAAFDSLGWNIGVGGFCRSSIPAHFKAHDLKGACGVIPLYNRAGNRVMPGLTFRRGEEFKVCMLDAGAAGKP